MTIGPTAQESSAHLTMRFLGPPPCHGSIVGVLPHHGHGKPCGQGTGSTILPLGPTPIVFSFRAIWPRKLTNPSITKLHRPRKTDAPSFAVRMFRAVPREVATLSRHDRATARTIFLIPDPRRFFLFHGPLQVPLAGRVRRALQNRGI